MNRGNNMSEITLYKGDCLIEMNKIADKSVDMILCDLPYGTTVCKWDVIIPFEKLWEQYNRVIKDNGAIVLFGKEPFSSKLRCSNIDMFKYDWYWKKDTKSNFPQASKQPLNNIEIISVFSKGYARCGLEENKTMIYNPQFIIGETYSKPKDSKTKGIFSENFRNGKFIHKDRDTSKRYPYNILDFNAPKKRLHPTQKPTDLLEYLIKTYALENEIVLDNCMGSGSTGVACINTNRNFIGIEKDDKYFEIAKDRIEKAKESLFDM